MINNFEFVQAQDLSEALNALSGKGRIVPLAGGTNVLVNMKRLPLEADLVVDLSRIESLQAITEKNESVSLGCGVTIADLLEWRPGGPIEALIRPMAANFAGPLIRNLATVGGNICDASPAADMSPPLLALDAQLKLESAGGASRVLSLEEFFHGVRRTAIRSDELLTRIELPRPDPSDQTFYYKLGKRKADAISIVSIALLLRLKSNKVTHVRIALGAVAPVAMRAHQAEEILLGNVLSERTITAAAAAAAAQSSPIDDFRASADYRRQMVDVLVKRGLEQITLKEH